jgi:hypothetical protein
MKRTLLFAALAAAVIASVPSARAASFTYHGVLQDGGKPAQGKYDIELTLYASPNGGSIVGGPVTMYGVDVSEGSFATEADFGPLAKSFKNAYVGVKVREAGKGAFTPLGNSEVAVETNSSCPGSWSLDGNAGNPSGSYIGTADATGVSMRANGVEFLYAPAISKAVALSGGGEDGLGPDATALSDGFGALGFASIAGGASAEALHDGSIVWGDRPTPLRIIFDTAPNQFITQATGGVGINTANGPLGTEPLGGTELTLRSTGGDGHQTWINLLSQRSSSTRFRGINLYSDPTSGASDYGAFGIRGIYNESSGGLMYEPIMVANFFGSAANSRIAFNRADPQAGYAIIVGTNTGNGNGAYLTIGGVWTNASSRTFKDGFSRVDAMDVLDKLVAMPVQSWFYKDDHQEGRHMGPVAEDFADAFGLGNDEKHIGTVDESGVAFAAIQGLNKKLETENSELRGKLDDVIARLSRLETSKGN